MGGEGVIPPPAGTCPPFRAPLCAPPPTCIACLILRVRLCVYAMLWCDTRMAAEGMFLVTTLCRYARVYCRQVEQLHVLSMGLGAG